MTDPGHRRREACSGWPRLAATIGGWYSLLFPGHRVSLEDAFAMGVRVEVEEGESIEEALKRFRRLFYDEGGYPWSDPRWHKKRHNFYLKPSVYRRRRRWVARQRWRRFRETGPTVCPSIAFELRPRYTWAW